MIHLDFKEKAALSRRLPVETTSLNSKIDTVTFFDTVRCFAIAEEIDYANLNFGVRWLHVLAGELQHYIVFGRGSVI